ncbi:MAG TPA: hypothetical protein VG317_17695 [Pseudonocardiaceae bacterium]|jgi:hypothetical protein|nr:hypothetical protein [Pseudonocardiaceae bacterium]
MTALLYLLAAIGVVSIAIPVWRALASPRVGAGARRRSVGPDDDPDFLRELDEQTKRDDGSDGGPAN